MFKILSFKSELPCPNNDSRHFLWYLASVDNFHIYAEISPTLTSAFRFQRTCSIWRYFVVCKCKRTVSNQYCLKFFRTCHLEQIYWCYVDKTNRNRWWRHRLKFNGSPHGGGKLKLSDRFSWFIHCSGVFPGFLMKINTIYNYSRW